MMNPELKEFLLKPIEPDLAFRVDDKAGTICLIHRKVYTAEMVIEQQRKINEALS
jgi:hypothetical protein